MGRARVYASDADRQRAYRARLGAGRPQAAPAAATPRRPPSRPSRLTRLAADIQALALEYERWLAALPDSLSETEQAARLTETVEQLTAAAELLVDVEPPKGFGRD